MEHFLDIIIPTLVDAIRDTLWLLPFLFATYLLMEWLEHKTAAKTQESIRRAGAAGPIVGGLLGAIPQCGFSAAAATLYAGRVITLGTVFAVFLATSDEMLPIFIAEQVPLTTILSIVGTKVVIGMIMGLLVDVVMRLVRRGEQHHLRIHELCERDKCKCGGNCSTCENNPELVYEHYDDCAQGCTHEHHHHDHDHETGWKDIFLSALIHTAQVAVFVFIIMFVLGIILEYVGKDTLANLLSANSVLSVFATAIVGLIPNCAASVAIAQLYVDGILGAGAMLAGLLVAAGVGILVLLRANRPMRENIVIIVVLYAMGVVCGLVVSALGITF